MIMFQVGNVALNKLLIVYGTIDDLVSKSNVEG